MVLIVKSIEIKHLLRIQLNRAGIIENYNGFDEFGDALYKNGYSKFSQESS